MADIIARAMAAKAQATAVGTTNGETVDARTGADSVARATLGAFVRELHQKTIDHDNQIANPAANTTATLQHGLNVVTTGAASIATPTIGGRTLVNLLGRDGNFETDSNADGVADGWIQLSSFGAKSVDSTWSKYGSKSQKITALSGDTSQTRGVYTGYKLTLNAGKYYVAIVDFNKSSASVTLAAGLYDNGTNKVTKQDLAIQTGSLYVKYAPTVDSSQIGLNLYNQDALGNTGWVSFDGARLYEVDSATYAKIDVDPEYTGDKLADKFPYVDSIKHVQAPMITKQGKNLLPPLTDSAWALDSHAVVAGPYSLTLNATVLNQASQFFIDAIPGQTYTVSIGSVSAGASIKVSEMDVLKQNIAPGGIDQATTSSFTFTAKAGTVYIRIMLYNNVTSSGTFIFTNPQLELGSTATAFEPQNIDYLYGAKGSTGNPLQLASNVDGTVKDSLFYRDGAWRKEKRWQTDVALDGSLSWIYNTDSTGYKQFVITNLLSNKPTTVGSLNIAKFDGKPLTYFLNTGGFTGGDQSVYGSVNLYLSVNDTDTGFGETYSPNATEIAAYFNGWKASTVDGNGKPTAWVSVVDGSAPGTNTLAYVSTTKAPNYTPYLLSYQLATTVEEVVTVEGAISLNPGGNQIEVSEGVIVREKILPKQNSSTLTWNINTADGASGFIPSGDQLKNKAAKILAVYKNGVQDKKWTVLVDNLAFGAQRVYCANADYDATAEYTVTYVLQDKYANTAAVTDVTADYQTTTKTILDHVVKRLDDDETAISVNVRAMAELYKRVKALGG